MNYRTMWFYPEFHCIGGICEDSCCENWEIDLDNDSVKLYKKQKGDFGKRLRDNMRLKDKQFILNGIRCPFLNDDNLCDIFTQMGEECLCQTCTNFPRHIEEFNDLKEVSLTISCPEACRIMLRYKDKISFVCKEGKDEDYGLKPMKPLSFFEKRKENKLNEALFDGLFSVREVFFEMLQNRELKVQERAAVVLACMDQIQRWIDEGEYNQLASYMNKNLDLYEKKVVVREVNDQYTEASIEELFYMDSFNRKKFMHQILNMYDGLENIKPEWKVKISAVMNQLQNILPEDYAALLKEFNAYMKQREYEFEHILVYYVFNYFLGASYDEDAMTKIKFAAISFLVIWELDFFSWLANNKEFTYENQVENAHAYSKEVEHSYNNFESLQLILAAHPILNVDNIMNALLRC